MTWDKMGTSIDIGYDCSTQMRSIDAAIYTRIFYKWSGHIMCVLLFSLLEYGVRSNALSSLFFFFFLFNFSLLFCSRKKFEIRKLKKLEEKLEIFRCDRFIATWCDLLLGIIGPLLSKQSITITYHAFFFPLAPMNFVVTCMPFIQGLHFIHVQLI